ncbi:hypothetical protein PAL_GLEAN10024685 [Pteropus alecto]|uniref:Uncharacterized protein n=1 Tax=Pteropus alecto TaxID=9402 RepID=L5JY61_PTEAL|nr:hypothetical protein PAL_GLEAN10024685 [Pteropus alecto]
MLASRAGRGRATWRGQWLGGGLCSWPPLPRVGRAVTRPLLTAGVTHRQLQQPLLLPACPQHPAWSRRPAHTPGAGPGQAGHVRCCPLATPPQRHPQGSRRQAHRRFCGCPVIRQVTE